LKIKIFQEKIFKNSNFYHLLNKQLIVIISKYYFSFRNYILVYNFSNNNNAVEKEKDNENRFRTFLTYEDPQPKASEKKTRIFVLKSISRKSN